MEYLKSRLNDKQLYFYKESDRIIFLNNLSEPNENSSTNLGELLIEMSNLDISNWNSIRGEAGSFNTWLKGNTSALLYLLIEKALIYEFNLNLYINDIQEISESDTSKISFMKGVFDAASNEDVYHLVKECMEYAQFILLQAIEGKKIDNGSLSLYIASPYLINNEYKMLYQSVNSPDTSFENPLKNILLFDYIHAEMTTILFKRCSNCDRYFIAETKKVKYCTHVYKDDKTCREIGYIKNMGKVNPFQKEYRKALNRHNAKRNYHKNNNPGLNYDSYYYEPWNNACIQARDYYKLKNDLEGFKKWIDENENFNANSNLNLD